MGFFECYNSDLYGLIWPDLTDVTWPVGLSVSGINELRVTPLLVLTSSIIIFLTLVTPLSHKILTDHVQNDPRNARQINVRILTNFGAIIISTPKNLGVKWPWPHPFSQNFKGPCLVWPGNVSNSKFASLTVSELLSLVQCANCPIDRFTAHTDRHTIQWKHYLRQFTSFTWRRWRK